MSKDEIRTTGKIIEELRLRRGWSQYELGRRIETNSATVRNWETDVNRPRSENLIALAKVFNVSVDYLLGLDDKLSVFPDVVQKEDLQLMETIFQLVKFKNSQSESKDEDRPET